MSTQATPNRTTVDRLTPRQHKAAVLLATGLSNEQAALSTGVAARTIAQWLKNEAFREELRQAMERTRQIFESRIMSLAANAAAVIQKLLSSNDIDQQTEGAKLALNAAVRLVGRYKELQVEGYVPPSAPLVVFPEGTKMPWAAPHAALMPGNEPIDVESKIVDEPDAPAEPAIDTI